MTENGNTENGTEFRYSPRMQSTTPILLLVKSFADYQMKLGLHPIDQHTYPLRTRLIPLHSVINIKFGERKTRKSPLPKKAR